MLRAAAEALASAGGRSRTATRCPVSPSSARYTVPNAPGPRSSRRRYRPPTCLPMRTGSPRETPPDTDGSVTSTSPWIPASWLSIGAVEDRVKRDEGPPWWLGIVYGNEWPFDRDELWHAG